uniref:Uncharacterized protein n=1 Tax=Strix occidentalis caurina TaxID=311401 RepID=A0A8D0FQV5_STROC
MNHPLVVSAFSPPFYFFWGVFPFPAFSPGIDSACTTRFERGNLSKTSRVRQIDLTHSSNISALPPDLYPLAERTLSGRLTSPFPRLAQRGCRRVTTHRCISVFCPLELWQCRLTEGSCGALAAVLPVCPSLRELHLGVNDLGDGGVRRLSEGLRDPACRLQALSLWKCQLTGACCQDLCAVLSTSRSLEHLDLSENNLGDGGMRLFNLFPSPLQRLKKSGLNEETLQKLGALKEIKPKLYIGYI